MVASILVLTGLGSVFGHGDPGTLATGVVILLPFLGIYLVAWIGWRDDTSHLGAAPRLIVHAVGAITLLPLVLLPGAIPYWMGWIAAVWWIFWAVSAINVVNFMDGIDGLVGAQAVVFGVHLALAAEGGLAGLFGSALAASALGFLCWNWSPARIFMGDVGSGALGFSFVLGGAFLMREAGVGLLAAYLPLYPLFLDALVTLTRRLINGERITEPHRSHVYQRLANGGWGHGPVAFLYAAAAVGGLGVARAVIAGAPSYLVLLYGTFILAVGAMLDRLPSREQRRSAERPSSLGASPSPLSD